MRGALKSQSQTEVVRSNVEDRGKKTSLKIHIESFSERD